MPDYRETVEKLIGATAWFGGVALPGRGGRDMPHQRDRRVHLQALRDARALLTAQAAELATLRERASRYHSELLRRDIECAECRARSLTDTPETPETKYCYNIAGDYAFPKPKGKRRGFGLASVGLVAVLSLPSVGVKAAREAAQDDLVEGHRFELSQFQEGLLANQLRHPGWGRRSSADLVDEPGLMGSFGRFVPVGNAADDHNDGWLLGVGKHSFHPVREVGISESVGDSVAMGPQFLLVGKQHGSEGLGDVVLRTLASGIADGSLPRHGLLQIEGLPKGFGGDDDVVGDTTTGVSSGKYQPERYVVSKDIERPVQRRAGLHPCSVSNFDLPLSGQCRAFGLVRLTPQKPKAADSDDSDNSLKQEGYALHSFGSQEPRTATTRSRWRVVATVSLWCLGAVLSAFGWYCLSVGRWMRCVLCQIGMIGCVSLGFHVSFPTPSSSVSISGAASVAEASLSAVAASAAKHDLAKQCADELAEALAHLPRQREGS